MAEMSEPLGLSRNAPSEPKASILLVDDNPANLLSLRALLEDLGQNLVEARSGEEALQRVQSDEFAVVLLDVLMPGISGFETAKAIRGQERSRHTPIIFLTASDIDRPQMEEGYALGAVDFLVKPLMPVALQAKVRGFVQLFQDKQRAKHEADQLRLLVHGTTEYAIFMLDPQGHIVTWNAGAERLKGYKADEIIGQHFTRFYPPDAIERGWPAHELKVAAAEGRFEDEGWRLRKDGSQFWANVVITALRDGQGNLQGFSKVTRDLTARKQAEEVSAPKRGAIPAAGRRGQGLRHLSARPAGQHRLVECRGRAHQGVQGRRDHRSALLPLLPPGSHRPGLARPRTEGRQGRGPVRGRGLAGPQGRHAVLGQRRYHRPPRRGREFRGLLEDHQGLDRAKEVGRERPPTGRGNRRRCRSDPYPGAAERLRVTLASIGDAVISTDAEGRVDFLNPVAEELVGWKTEEAADADLDDVFRIVNEDTRQPVENPAMRALKEGVIVGLANHTVLISKDGNERPIDDCAAPIRDAEGNVIGSVLVFRDVSEQRGAAQASRKNQELLQLIHKIGKIGHWEWNSLTDENKWSPEIEALYGLPPGGFEGGYQGWAKLLHPDDLPKAEQDVRRAMETGEYFSEFRVIWPDGSVHWLETRAHVFKDNQDKPVRIMGVNMDITERKQREESSRFLAEASAALAGVVDYESTLQKVANLAVPYFADWSAVDVANEDGTLRRLAVAHQDADKIRLWRTS